MEELIEEEVTELCRMLEHKCGNFMDCAQLFNIAVLNSLWKLLTNEKLKHDDPKLISLVKQTKESMEKMDSPFSVIALSSFPVYSFLAKTGIFDLKQCTKPVFNIVEPIINEHEATFDFDSHHRDLIDAYLARIKEEEGNESSSFNGNQRGDIYLRPAAV